VLGSEFCASPTQDEDKFLTFMLEAGVDVISAGSVKTNGSMRLLRFLWARLE
jgi:hypothetical protein